MTDQRMSLGKFHPVFGSDLRVALEVTLPPDERVTPAEGWLYQPDLVHYARVKSDPYSPVFAVRVYYPAVVEGDIQKGDREVTIQFVPWAYETNAQYHRLCFWAQPAKGKWFWMRLARFGEEKSFGFNPDKPYINIDFLSKRSEFIPVFVKARDRETMDIVYFVIEAQASEDEVKLIIRRVEENEAPPHLVSENP